VQRLNGEHYGECVRTTVHAFLIAVTAALLGGANASAHHSFAAEFDAQKPVTLKGTVVKWEMINPHGWITLAVTGPDGKATQWMIKTSNPNGLMRLGWSKRSLKFGGRDEVRSVPGPVDESARGVVRHGAHLGHLWTDGRLSPAERHHATGQPASVNGQSFFGL
jgi:Family of unknown function (DUF6152)